MPTQNKLTPKNIRRLIWLRRLVMIVWLPCAVLGTLQVDDYRKQLVATRPEKADAAAGFTVWFSQLKPDTRFVTPDEAARFDALALRTWLIWAAGFVIIVIIETPLRRLANSRVRTSDLFFLRDR